MSGRRDWAVPVVVPSPCTTFQVHEFTFIIVILHWVLHIYSNWSLPWPSSFHIATYPLTILTLWHPQITSDIVFPGRVLVLHILCHDLSAAPPEETIIVWLAGSVCQGPLTAPASPEPWRSSIMLRWPKQPCKLFSPSSTQWATAHCHTIYDCLVCLQCSPLLIELLSPRRLW